MSGITLQGVNELTNERVKALYGSSKHITIDGYKIIGECAFIGSSVRKVEIGKCVEEIKNNAFKLKTCYLY